jgi:pSer/pThr/pTyr-binding forkhead associated (FHA) protein
MFKLILRFQDTVIKEFEFQKTPVKMGRREDNDIVINQTAISGHHCQIDQDGDDLVLTDNNSLNGTLVNDEKITKQKLHHGDVIAVGKHLLEVILESPPVAAPDTKPETEHSTGGAHYEPTVTSRDEPEPEKTLMEELGPDKPETAPLPERPKRFTMHGYVTIIKGGAQQIVELTNTLTTLGKAAESDIVCSGLLVGRKAAIINKRPNGFFLAYSDGLKKPEVNGQQVITQIQLQDGDEIIIGNTKMTFSLITETQ